MNDLDRNLLPITKKIFASNISANLVPVVPLGTDADKLEKIKSEVNSINRDSKISSIIDDVPYESMDVSDHPEYKNTFTGSLLYMDYMY